MEAFEIVFLIGRMNLVIHMGKADEERIEPENGFKSPTTGMEPPAPVMTAGLSHSAVRPASAFDTKGPSAGTVMAGEPP